MADRKQFESVPALDQELVHLLDETQEQPITEDELREQRISFANGKAPYRCDDPKTELEGSEPGSAEG